MQIIQGCLAPGSKITMEDGSERVIEKFDGGERVKTRGGKNFTVAATLWGRESNPLVRITTADGHSVMMSNEHPVPTGRGILRAKELAVGDIVYTSGGESQLTAVMLEPYNGTVYNLGLTGQLNDPTLTPENRTFYTDSILVGDSAMQFYWSRLATRSAGQRQIPMRWLTDYQNSRKDVETKQP
jgi:hypothetical protein